MTKNSFTLWWVYTLLLTSENHASSHSAHTGFDVFCFENSILQWEKGEKPLL